MEIEINSAGHELDAIGVCIQCNGCLVEGCCGIDPAVCAWVWVGGLPAKRPVKL